MRSIVAFVLAVIFGLPACSSEARRFDDVSSLAVAVSEVGISCDRSQPGPEAELVEESISCGGSDVRLYLFGSEQNLRNWSEVGSRIAPVVIGPNWAVTGEEASLRVVAEELGGDLQTGR